MPISPHLMRIHQMAPEVGLGHDTSLRERSARYDTKADSVGLGSLEESIFSVRVMSCSDFEPLKRFSH